MYAMCCRLRGASFRSEVVDAVEHLLAPDPTPPPPVSLSPFVKVKIV